MNESKNSKLSLNLGESMRSTESSRSKKSTKSKIPRKSSASSRNQIKSAENSKISVKSEQSVDQENEEIQNEENDIEIYEEYKNLQSEISKLIAYKRMKEREVEELKVKSQKEIHIYLRKIEYLTNKFNTQPKQPIPTKKTEIDDIAAEKETFMSEIHDSDSDLTKQKKFSKFIDQIESIYKNNYNNAKFDLEQQKIKEVSEARKNANNAIEETELQHATEMEQLQNYYQKSTHEQLETIRDLKSKIARLKPQDSQQTEEFSNSEKQKNRILEEIEKLKKENDSLNKKVVEAQLTRKELEEVTEVVNQLTDEKENAMIAEDILSRRFEQLEEERNAMYDQFEAMIKDVHQKAEFRGFILAQKIQKMNEMLDQKERQLQASITKGSITGDMQVKLDKVLAEKTSRISQLETQLANMHNAYEKMTDMYEAKIASFGIDPNTQ